jgi:hypothetical protein
MRILVAMLLLVASSATASEAEKVNKGRSDKAAKKTAAAKAADPNAVLAKTHGGKVWVTSESLPSVEGEELGKWLSARPNSVELTQKPKEDRWPINYVAVFKKPPAKGPMTVEFFDKNDPKNMVDQYSPETPGSGLVFQEAYDLDANNGFNKGRTYVMRVGQLIKNRFVSYATAEITLK